MLPRKMMSLIKNQLIGHPGNKKNYANTLHSKIQCYLSILRFLKINLYFPDKCRYQGDRCDQCPERFQGDECETCTPGYYGDTCGNATNFFALFYAFSWQHFLGMKQGELH